MGIGGYLGGVEHVARVVARDGALWIGDGAHEYLAVPLGDCAGLEVSRFSFVDVARGLAYLEGDCDAALWFGSRSCARSASSIAAVDHGRRSWVRDLARFGGGS
jgi:hypothetical protein